MTSGYHNNPERTAEAFTDDGWLRTGDRGYLAQGQLYIVGREKDIIKKGGSLHDATDLEDALWLLFNHPEFQLVF